MYSPLTNLPYELVFSIPSLKYIDAQGVLKALNVSVYYYLSLPIELFTKANRVWFQICSCQFCYYNDKIYNVS